MHTEIVVHGYSVQSVLKLNYKLQVFSHVPTCPLLSFACDSRFV